MQLLTEAQLAVLTPDELMSYEAAVTTYLALSSPADYATHCDPAYERPAHIVALNEAIVAVLAGGLPKADGTPYRKLLVTMPPRHGKSETVSKFTPAWFVTKYPDKKVAVASYEAEFAASWGRRARDLVEAHPEFGVRVSPASKAAHRWDIEDARGGMFTAGAGGAITGKGAHLFIIDDPVKNAEEANSALTRESTWDWYRSTALTRLEPGAVIILVQTRWHEDDLAGRLLREEPDEWFHIDLPALASDHDPIGRRPGEALWPQRYDERALQAIRESVGAIWWAALYQQSPQIEGGNIFRQDDLRFFSTFEHDGHRYYRLLLPGGGQKDIVADKCWRFTTVDLAASTRTSADFTVFALWGVTPDKELLLLDLYRERIEGADHMQTLARLHEQWRPRFHGVERATYGLSLLQTATRVGRIPVRELKPDWDKVSRAYSAAALLQAGKMYFARGTPWLETYLRELLVFPNGAHDDCVDATAYAALVLGDRLFAPSRASRTDVPTTMEQKLWANLGKRKKRDHHPDLGRGF